MKEDTVSQNSFREAMAAVASSVCVLTTDGPSGRYGITVSSLCSVTDDPPTLLACINRKGIANELFKNNKNICVNVLNASQENIGMHYAKGHDYQQSFDKAIWNFPKELPPELIKADAIFQGTVASTVEHGTHSVFFIQITHIKYAHTPTGLVYFQRRFVPLS